MLLYCPYMLVVVSLATHTYLVLCEVVVTCHLWHANKLFQFSPQNLIFAHKLVVMQIQHLTMTLLVLIGRDIDTLEWH